MPGWDGVAIPELIHARHPVPVLVDNDVNIMAVGEYSAGWRDQTDDFLFIKVGTGIGCGVILHGRIHRGAQGTAGDVGHIRVRPTTGLATAATSAAWKRWPAGTHWRRNFGPPGS